MKKMKAIVRKDARSNDFILMDIPVPQIDEDEILIKIKAIGVGIQDGYFFPKNIDLPYPIGVEGSGIIEIVGKNRSDFKAGDRVAFLSIEEPKGGAYAEYIVIGSRSLAIPIPDDMSFVEAAAIPVAGNANIKIYKSLKLNYGDKIFIAGASGANGTFAIQFAKEIGCTISASASKANHRYMKSLGVDKSVDYQNPNWINQILEWAPGGVDAAIAIQPETSIDSMKVVKDGGKIISVSGEKFVSERSIQIVEFPFTLEVREELFLLMEKIAYGEIKLNIENIYDFNHAFDALDKVRTRRAQGKSVIIVEE